MATIFGQNPAGEVIDGLDGVTNDDDTIIGNAGGDWIYGLGGNDTIKGGGGADKLHGGIGNDTLVGDGAYDLYDGGEGIDTLALTDALSGMRVDLVTGTVSKMSWHGPWGTGSTVSGVENVTGSQYDDLLIGDGKDNVLSGAGGADTLAGGGGNDTLLGDGRDDAYDGGTGTDTLDLSAAITGMRVDLGTGLVVKIGHPFAQSSAANIENVTGSQYFDSLVGDQNANVINGAAGGDHILGGGGADQMHGGAGADTFFFEAIADSAVTGGVIQDTIWDFVSGEDKLNLSWLEQPAADLLMINSGAGSAPVSVIGFDANHNNQFDAGEFAVTVHVTNGFLTQNDLLL